MKKIILTLIFGVSLVSFGFSFDFGLNIDNFSQFFKSDTEQIYTQSNTAGLWLSQKSEVFEAAVSLSYTFMYVDEQDTSLLEPGIFDLDYLYYIHNLVFEESNSIDDLELQVGRFIGNDLSKLVFNSKLDGIKLEIGSRNLSFGAQAFYSGLLLNKTSPILMSLLDENKAMEGEDNFGSKRFIYSAYALVEEFALRQNLGLEFVGQNDLTDRNQEFIDSYYLSLILNGPIVPALQYNFLTLYELANTSAGLEQFLVFDGKLQLSVPDLKGSFALTGTYSIPFQDSGLSFKPIVASSLSFVNSFIDTQNVNALGLSGVFNFSSSMSFTTKVQAYLRQSLYDVYVPYTDVNKEGSYVGSEVSMSLGFNPTSDFTLSLTGGLLFLNEAIVLEGEGLIPFKVSLAASLFI